MARERGVTARQKREFLEFVASGASITKAAEMIDRAPSVFLNRADKSHAIYDEVFAAAFAEALNSQAAVNAGRADGDMDTWAHEESAAPQIRLAWVKRWNPAYRETQQVEVTGKNGGALEVAVEHDHSRLLDGLEEIGLLRRGPVAAADAAVGDGAEAPAVLPARTD